MWTLVPALPWRRLERSGEASPLAHGGYREASSTAQGSTCYEQPVGRGFLVLHHRQACPLRAIHRHCPP